MENNNMIGCGKKFEGVGIVVRMIWDKPNLFSVRSVKKI